MTRLGIQLLLALAGLTLVALGAAILVTPHAFFATNGILLGSDPSLLSEIRAPGAILALSGLFVVRGVVQRSRRRQALQIATVVYGAYGAARLLSIVLDGAPGSSLLWATGIELGFALLCASVIQHEVVLQDAEQSRAGQSRTTDHGLPAAA
ncbi:MAG: DUF4345 domain-containing protein [Bacteroidota bacterium]